MRWSSRRAGPAACEPQSGGAIRLTVPHTTVRRNRPPGRGSNGGEPVARLLASAQVRAKKPGSLQHMTPTVYDVADG
ncbi:hypothetical protein R52603_00696 [Paraburkholderia saeva]|uniref:Uncharacterized protein n=1 Tax=Paraburkholderia saeva TaxID=2777537 RepID=A0A9N8RWP2_9BURK|nr:hypothetical protein R52603_00696 [Paraburkholderia saeva]CAG4893485.1 hypothetical protein R70241_01580 [Paraburkholderia saeva]CAG4895849.1 hypothetical protein LMG31841_02241 [Paraburkholderia saeva]